jgi:AcrR family transcriptional regulator
MSPYPAQVNRDAIVDQARDIIESEGLKRLTLQHLAAALGIQAPSLYRHVGSKNELLQAVNEITMTRLIDAVLAAAEPHSLPEARVWQMACAYRAFAQRFPATYSLAFTANVPELRMDAVALDRLVQPVEKLLGEVAGPDHAMTAFRTLLALLHGFVMLELAGQFQRGGDLNVTFAESVDVLIRGWRAA